MYNFYVLIYVKIHVIYNFKNKMFKRKKKVHFVTKKWSRQSRTVI
jgi:hypothetical protein